MMNNDSIPLIIFLVIFLSLPVLIFVDLSQDIKDILLYFVLVFFGVAIGIMVASPRRTKDDVEKEQKERIDKAISR